MILIRNTYSEKTRTTNLGMIAIWIFWFSSCAAIRHEIIIPIHTERNTTQIDVKIGDIEVPKIILDTGMSNDGLLIYNPEYLSKFDLAESADYQIGGAGDQESSTAKVIDHGEFCIGSIKMKDQRIIILTSDSFKGFPSNGVLGYSIFGHYTTEIDYDRKAMILHDPGKFELEGNWTEIPMYFKDNNIPWIDVSVITQGDEIVKLSAYIDFAAGCVIELLEKPDMKCSLPSETTDAYLGRGLSGDIHGKTGTIRMLAMGPHELKNVTASIAPAEIRSKQKNADAIIGNGALQFFNLIFDYKNKKLYVKPNHLLNERNN